MDQASDENDILDADDLDFLHDMLGDDYNKPNDNLGMNQVDDIVNRTRVAKGDQKMDNNHTKKCSGVFLGGTDLKPGITLFLDEPRFCSSLFCLSCQHVVLRFTDCRWSKQTTFLFLKKNYPNNVQPNLSPANGWCAFCCQCTFLEENSLQKLGLFSSNWVCHGHS